MSLDQWRPRDPPRGTSIRATPMQDPNWQRIKQLFAAAAALPPEQHAAFLAENEPDPAIRAEVLSLLAAHSPTVAPAGGASAAIDGPGSRIGPYKLLEVIGEGGYGTVYAAEQEVPVRRRVALKIVKAGMDSRQVIARFEQERQALALMDHPNIARVFDGGATPSGRPFFVMELVKGDPITEYCDREKLTTAERLRLFVDVGRAVQHAHQKGVIHRDLKPSNVLVTLVDGKAIAKVIDFGVAKATQGRLTDKTLFTEHKQMIGTPLYMSPEQAHISGVDVDTRSDVYSLGVLLYELLTGTTPFRKEELLEAGLAEMHRVLREVEPQKPSTRVATLGKTSGAVAAQRRVEVAKWNALLRGDLDWIVMKCLEKERARRYETASDLVKDVERHLNGEAVLAAPPSLGYRVRKFVRRKKGQVGAGVVVAASCASAIGVVVWTLHTSAEDANQRRAEAELSQRAAEWQSYLGNIVAADAALQRGEGDVARERLEACATHLRDLEWRNLDARSDQSLLTIGPPPAAESSKPITFEHIDISPDGRHVLAALSDGTARAYDLADGHEAVVYSGHTKGLCTARYVRDGAWVLSASYDGTACLWEARRGTRIQTFPHGSPVNAALSVPGDDLVVTAGADTAEEDPAVSQPIVWKAADGSKVCSLGTPGLRYEGGAIAVIGKDSRIVTGNSQGCVEVWNPRTGERLASIAVISGWISSLSASPDGRYVVVGSNWGHTSNALVACDLEEARVVKLPSGTGRRDHAFAPDGRTVIVSSQEFRWEADTRIPCSTWEIEVGSWSRVGPPQAFAGEACPRPFDRDGSLMVTRDDHCVHVWNRSSDKESARLVGGYRADQALLTPDGTRVVTLGRHGAYLARRTAIQVWDAATPPQIHELGGWNDSTKLCRLSPNGDVAFTGDGDRPARIWDTATGSLIATLPVGPDLIAVAFRADGQLLATAGGDNVARVWSCNSGELVATLAGHAGVVTSVAFSSTDDAIYTASLDGTARSWRVSGREPAPPTGSIFDGHTGPVQHVAVSPDGSRIVTASGDRSGRVWSAKTGQPICPLLGHTEGLTFATFSGDGRLVATTTGTWNNSEGDMSTRVWDATTGIPVHTLTCGDGAFRAEFSPDGAMLLTESHKEVVRAWSVASGQPLPSPPTGVRDLTLCANGHRAIGFANGDEAWILEPTTMRRIASIRSVNGGNSLYGTQISRDGKVVALGSNWETGSLIHLTPYRERFPAVLAIRRAIERTRDRVEDRRKQHRSLQELRTELLSDSSLSRIDRRAVSMCIAEIEYRNETEAAQLLFRIEKASEYPEVEKLSLDEQLTAARRAVDLTPSNPAIHRAFGSLLFRADQFAAAAAEFETAAVLLEKRERSEPREWALLAMAHSRLGRLAEASAALTKARGLVPDYMQKRGEQDPDVARAEAEFRKAFPEER